MFPVGAVAGFLGAWLLVAGPVYQAATELESEQVDRTAFADADLALPDRRRVSAWWWLLPPLGLILQRRATWRHRERVLAVMSATEVDRLVTFGAKATGWLLVAVGGLLIAVKETRDLVESLHWSGTADWVLVPVALALALLYAVVRLRRDRRSRAEAGTARKSDADDG